MFRLWLTLRRLRQHATPRSNERGAIEAYLRAQGAFGEEAKLFGSFARSVCAAVVIVLVVSVSLSSYAYASDAVLPDTPLYPVRQVLEEMQVKLAVTPVKKEKVQQKLVERRIKEVKKLKELKRPVPVKLKKYLEVPVTTTTGRLKQQEKMRTKQRVEVQAARTKVIDRLRNELPNASSTNPVRVRDQQMRAQKREEQKKKREGLRAQAAERRAQNQGARD